MPTNPDNERYTHNFSDHEEGWGEGTDSKDGYVDIIDALETDVAVRDVSDNISSYRPLDGRWFIPTDSEDIHRGDGTSWIQLDSYGKTPSFDTIMVGADGELQSLLGGNLKNDSGTLTASDTNTQLSDGDVQTAINNDPDHGSTAPHNYFSGLHTDLVNLSTDDHHTKYTDSETMAVVQGMDVDAQTVDGYDIQVGGTEPTDSTTIWFDQA